MMLALSPILIGLSMFLLMAVCILLILTILIQRPQGGGLSGAFGSGAGSGQTAFGTKTGDALTIFTIIMFIAFVLCSVLLVFVTRPGQGPLVQPTAEQAPAEAPTGPAGATDQGTAAPAAGQPGDTATPPVQPPMDDKPADPTTAPQSTPPTAAPVAPPASTPPAEPAPK
ncbi:MAG: preprotein translocase subunit SecG [Phycisphaerales bacterium]|nr:preprotein translocase subunit SecG [Phycisphaerales bacterium]